jgi:hypothetical protein
MKEGTVMRGVPARECARWRNSGRNCNVQVLVQVLWEPERLHACSPGLARWRDGSNGKSGRRQAKRWRGDATLL